MTIPKHLRERVDNTVGFQAVTELGDKLSNSEIKDIVEYTSYLGEDPKVVEKVLRTRGRPFSVNYGFNDKCTLCRNLRNYCCC